MDKEDKAIVILVLLGMLLVVTGIALISIPAALIVAGVLLVAVAANIARRKVEQTKKCTAVSLWEWLFLFYLKGGEIKDE